MQSAHESNVRNQFGPRAEAYVASAVHALGQDLADIASLAREAAPREAIDLGCGGGHVTYALAPHAGRVTATDLSPDMLSAVATTAKSKGFDNVRTVEASVERLPFDAESFDFLGCRYSAHHWQDVDAGLREARRVLKKDAPAVFIDVYAPGNPLLDTHLQAVELLRDTSHVRDYSLAEWSAKLAAAGFAVKASRTWRLKMEFDSWTARIGTPELLRNTIRALQQSAPAEVKAHFEIEPDGSFMLDMVMFETAAR